MPERVFNVFVLSVSVLTVLCHSRRFDGANGVWYEQHDEMLVFHEARSHCASRGGHLPRIHSRQDLSSLVDAVRNDTTYFWLDATCNENDVCTFGNGENVNFIVEEERESKTLGGVYVWTPDIRQVYTRLGVNSGVICQFLRTSIRLERLESRFLNLENDIKDKFEELNRKIDNLTQIFTNPTAPLNPNVLSLQGISSGDIFKICGTPSGNGFVINIFTNSTGYNRARSDIALQLNVDFERRVAKRTCRRREDWSRDEVYGAFPFEERQQFEIVIRVDDMRFYIDVDGQQFCSFDHRINQLHNIDLIRIEGDVSDVKITKQ